MVAELGEVGPDGVEALSSGEKSAGTGIPPASPAPDVWAPPASVELAPDRVPRAAPFVSGIRRHPTQRECLGAWDAWHEVHVQFAAMRSARVWGEPLRPEEASPTRGHLA